MILKEKIGQYATQAGVYILTLNKIRHNYQFRRQNLIPLLKHLDPCHPSLLLNFDNHNKSTCLYMRD